MSKFAFLTTVKEDEFYRNNCGCIPEAGWSVFSCLFACFVSYFPFHVISSFNIKLELIFNFFFFFNPFESDYLSKRFSSDCRSNTGISLTEMWARSEVKDHTVIIRQRNSDVHNQFIILTEIWIAAPRWLLNLVLLVRGDAVQVKILTAG